MPRRSYNGVSDSGGGATLPDTPDIVLLDASVPDTIVGLDPSGVGIALSYDDARTALGLTPVDIALGGYETCDGALMVSGGLRFDPADYARAGKTTVLTLRFLGDVSAAITGTVTFYNLTGAASAGSISVTSTTAGNHQTAAVTLPGVASSYELRLSHGGVDTQYLTQRAAVLRVTWS